MRSTIIWQGDLDDGADFEPVIVEDGLVEWHRSDDPLWGIHFFSIDHAARFGVVQLPLLNTVPHGEAI